MLPFVDMMQCQNLAVPMDVMHHVVQVESSANPYAIGVVGGRLVRQPRNLAEAVATAEMLESRGYNFSVGLAQVNRYNLRKYGVASYAQAFDGCVNLRAGARILSECHARAQGDWGSAFSCYYSGNFTTGYQHGYVQKIFASIAGQRAGMDPGNAIPVVANVSPSASRAGSVADAQAPLSRRVVGQDDGQETLSRSASQDAAAPVVSAARDVAASAAAAAPGPAQAAPSASGVVRLTRNGPVFPTPLQGQKPEAAPAPAAAPQVADAAGKAQGQAGDNAFVF
ncbi:lytic transglycosylase domain-containing protein [Pseudoxanthomonas winnipegensis]|uniref:lytic transglycosylase domain-containing protein n=1 Tax=Pseudoxanthomonas winnipegensis TaxID=2480810 RepID=UPI003CCFF129